MNWDKFLPDIGSGESSRRIREALRVEKDKRHGQIGKIEASLSLSSGWLAKACRGEMPIPMDRLLMTLERMGIDSGRFFANALGARPDNDSLLGEIERFGDVDPRLARIEKATRQLEATAPPGPAPAPIDAGARVADFVTCSGTEQRRRLGTARKYRHPAFAAAYLEHLDALRYDHPKEARQNAEAMAVKLIPYLPGPRPETIALQLETIGVYASCHRQQGKWATAARALRLALGIARAHGLKQSTAELLQRAAYLLIDHGRYPEAMTMLDEALVIYLDLDSQVGLGTVTVDRGMALNYLGEYRAAVQALKKSLKLLRKGSLRTDRNRLAAYQVLGLAYQGMGDLERAEGALAQAVVESKQAGRGHRASLLWEHGVLAFTRKSFHLAEQSLREAAELFERLQDPNKALVALDLTKALVAQGKTLEAVAVATSNAGYLTAFAANRVAEAAISEFIQTALEGDLTLEGVERMQERLLSARGRPPGKPPR